jgi:hypothetical protein
MRRLAPLFAVAVTLAWALWFGGLITLFLAVTSLFDTFSADRALAGTAAAGIFRRFESYQLFLAAVAVVAAALWRVSDPVVSPRRRTIVLMLLALSAGMALVSTFVVSNRIENLRQNGLTDTPEFRRLHGLSMTAYSAESLTLLVAGLLLPGAFVLRGGVVHFPPPGRDDV